MSEKNQFGDEAKCNECDREIVYVGIKWEHRYGTYNHIAVPKRNKIHSDPNTFLQVIDPEDHSED